MEGKVKRGFFSGSVATPAGSFPLVCAAESFSLLSDAELLASPSAGLDASDAPFSPASTLSADVALSPGSALKQNQKNEDKM
jgi:hypothetical protein